MMMGCLRVAALVAACAAAATGDGALEDAPPVSWMAADRNVGACAAGGACDAAPTLAAGRRIWVDVGTPSLLHGEARCFDDVFVVMLNPVIEDATGRYHGGIVEGERGVVLPLALSKSQTGPRTTLASVFERVLAPGETVDLLRVEGSAPLDALRAAGPHAARVSAARLRRVPPLWGPPPRPPLLLGALRGTPRREERPRDRRLLADARGPRGPRVPRRRRDARGPLRRRGAVAVRARRRADLRRARPPAAAARVRGVARGDAPAGGPPRGGLPRSAPGLRGRRRLPVLRARVPLPRLPRRGRLRLRPVTQFGGEGPL